MRSLGVPRCSSQASLSKRAQSTTLTSLHLESTVYGHARSPITAIVISPPMSRDHLRVLSSITSRGRRLEASALFSVAGASSIGEPQPAPVCLALRRVHGRSAHPRPVNPSFSFHSVCGKRCLRRCSGLDQIGNVGLSVDTFRREFPHWGTSLAVREADMPRMRSTTLLRAWTAGDQDTKEKTLNGLQAETSGRNLD